MKPVPRLTHKRPQDVDPDSLTAALFWDQIADPGDYDASQIGAAASGEDDGGGGGVRIYVHKPLGSDDIDLGGPGSGNWAHVGRPGFLGGSAARNKGMTIAKGKDWLERYERVAGRPHPFAETMGKGGGTKAERLKKIDDEITKIEARKDEIEREKTDLVSQWSTKKINGAQYMDSLDKLNEEIKELNARHEELIMIMPLLRRSQRPQPLTTILTGLPSHTGKFW